MLSLNNEAVDAILLESARPRTRELYSRELVIFLGKGIPQTPDINTENFNKIFYVPLMKSLNDLINLHDLLGEETTNHSNNKSKMPSELYGTKDSPGHVALWIISLGHQKDAVLQWLGKDELLKHKTVALAVKYIRSKLMEARSQSEARQDLDAKLTPIKYEEIRHTQAESYQRHQVNVSTRTPFRIPDHRLSDARSKSSFSALQMSHSQDELAFQAPHDPDDFIQENITDNVSYEQNDEDHYIGSSDTHSPQDNPPMDVNPLNAVADVNSVRSAIASTFRGYCCEYFVFGTCPKRYSGCSYDTSFETPNPRDAPPTQESLLRAASTAAGIEKDRRRQKLEDQRNIMIEELRQAEVASLEKEIQELSSKIIAENTRTPVVVDLVEPVLPTPPKSTDTTTTKVTSRTPSPLLPLPQLPIEIPIAQKMTIIDKTRTITLDGKITSDMALKFYQQARQADFSLHWTQCIMDQTLELIKLRVRTSYTLLRITEEEANNWNPTLLTTREMADIIYTYTAALPGQKLQYRL